MGIRVEHLCKWRLEATLEVEPDDTHRRKVVVLVQVEFRDGTISEDCTWQTVVLISKGCRREFRGIGPVDILWKKTTNIINQGLTLAIRYHSTLHLFWEWRTMGISTFEANIL